MSQEERITQSWEMEMRKGYIRLATLIFLNKKPLTGYDIIKEVEKETLGFWSFTPGGVYPMLKELETEGFILGQWNAESKRKKKTYELTDDGKRILKTALLKQQQMAEVIGGLFNEFAREIFGFELKTSPEFFFPFGKNLEEKPVIEQKLLLLRVRTKMLNAIKIIDERLEKLHE